MPNNIPCPVKVDCPGTDTPFRNFSSEAPDIPSEPIPLGGLYTPYVPPPLSPETGGGTGLPTCPTGFRYDPATGTCISNAIFPPPEPPGCAIELKILSARVGNDSCGWIDMTALLNSLRTAPTNCDGCYWRLNLTASMLGYSTCPNPVLEVRYKQNGLTALLTYSGGDDYLMDFTPSACFCLEHMHFEASLWGNDTQGYIDVSDILNENIVARHLCYCPGYPDNTQCCGAIVIQVNRETLGNFAPNAAVLPGKLKATAYYYGVRQYTETDEGDNFGREFQIATCPEPPPDPPPDPPKYACINGACVQDAGGSYLSIEECLAAGCEDPPPPPECPPGEYFEPLVNACVPIANPCDTGLGFTRFFANIDITKMSSGEVVTTDSSDPLDNPFVRQAAYVSQYEICVRDLSTYGTSPAFLWYNDNWPAPESFIGRYN